MTVSSHFTIPHPTQHEAPRVEKNVDPNGPTVLSTSNVPTLPGARVTVTLPALGLPEPLVLSLAPKRIPAGFGGGVAFDVKVRRSDGSFVTDFSSTPLEIRIDNVSSVFAPHTSSDNVTWTPIDRLGPRAGGQRSRRRLPRRNDRLHLHAAPLVLRRAAAEGGGREARVVDQRRAARRHAFTVRAKSTLKAIVTGHLYSPKKRHVYKWRFKVGAGVSKVKLRWPAKVRARGVYTVVWFAQANGQVTKRTTKIRLR